MKQLSSIFLIILFSNVWAAASQTNHPAEALFIKAQAIFEQSLAGDNSVTEEAFEQFKQLSQNYPDNPLFLAYYGSSYTLLGRDAWMPWNKIGYTEKGLDIIGKALQMLQAKHDFETLRGAPISIETRLVAITTFLKVPKSFNHFEKAKAVLNEVWQSPAFATSPQSLKKLVYEQAAKLESKQ